MSKKEPLPQLPLPFQVLPTHRRNDSWNKMQKKQLDTQLAKVVLILSGEAALSSRQIADRTGIERTSVTRTLATNADYFDTELQTYDQKTKRYVTLYRLKDKMEGTL